MATDVAATDRIEVGRPATAAVIWAYLRYTNRGFWRSPIAAFFTIVFPLLFLVLLGALIGNETIPRTGGLRIAQFLTPAIGAFAATTASFTSLAIGLVIDREEGILKRARGMPLAPWMFMVARIGSTVWIAMVSLALMVIAGVVFFDVQLIARTAPAAVLTVITGIGCFAALGLAVVSVVRSQGATQAVTNAIILPLAFISDIFALGELPAWLERIGWFFPLKHFVNALADTFNPFAEGAQFGWDHLAVMVVWGLAGALVAMRFFHWEPKPGGARAAGSAVPAGVAAQPQLIASELRAAEHAERPGVAMLIANQVGYTARAFLRNTTSAFFIIGFPVVLLLLVPVVFGSGEMASRGGVETTQFLAPVLAVFGAATAAYSDFAERVAFARDRGVLKRIHGTPLPVWAFVAGRMLTAVLVAFASLVVTVGVGMIVYGVQIVPRALPGLLLSVVVGVSCFAALGLALAVIAPDARAVPAIANATLLPLSFFSDIFLIGDAMPRWMEIIGWIFPLKHFANAVADGVNPTIPGVGIFGDHLAVMAAWMVVGMAVALRFWSWEPRGR